MKAHHGRKRMRKARLFSTQPVAECVGEVYKDCEIFGLTKGQFSLFDLVEYVLDRAGPSDVTIATWTAAGADATRAFEFLRNGRIRSIRWIVDRSFKSRQPDYCRTLISLFGNDCIRTTAIHGKFTLIRNDDWNFVIRTSMNLNQNKRIENFEISEDFEFASWFDSFVDEIFEMSPSDNFSGWNLNDIGARTGDGENDVGRQRMFDPIMFRVGDDGQIH